MYCTLHPSTILRLFQIVPPRPLGPGGSFSFELTGSHGAALVTKYQTYQEDCESESTFKSYTQCHYDSWVTFARHKQYGDDVRPVLVTGLDMTRDFAMVAYSDEGPLLESDSIVAVPTPASTSVWGTWRTRRLCYTNHGPKSPPPCELPIDLSSSQQADTRSIPERFNQCVFIRYFTMRRRLFFPQVIKTGLGSHDPGSGHDGGDNFPELTVEPDVEPTTSGDEDIRQWHPATDISFEPDNAIPNTPYV